MNAPLNPALPGGVPGAIPGVGTLPIAARALPTLPGAPGAPVAAFAQDLAQLLLGSVLPAAPAAVLGSTDVVAEPAGDADEGTLSDAVAALWIELGIAAQPAPAMPPANPPAGTAMQAVPGAASIPTSSLASAPQPLAVSADILAKVDAQPAANDAVPFDMPPAAAAPVFTVPESPRAMPTPPAVVDVRLPQAPQQIAETVVWNVGKGLTEVQIRLSPEDLGPLDVHLKLDGDKVAVRFDAADANVRDVVQTSLPQLATLLSARGLQLDQAQVFQQDRGQPQAQPGPLAERRADGESSEDEPQPLPQISRRRGLFDDWV